MMKKLLSVYFICLCCLGISFSVQAATVNLTTGIYALNSGGGHKIGSSTVYNHTKSNVIWNGNVIDPNGASMGNASIGLYTLNTASGKTGNVATVTPGKDTYVPLAERNHPGNSIELRTHSQHTLNYKVKINSGRWIVE